MRFLEQIYPPCMFGVYPVKTQNRQTKAVITTHVREHLWQRILFAHAIAARKPKAREHRLR